MTQLLGNSTQRYLIVNKRFDAEETLALLLKAFYTEDL